ncbi:bifunctional deaminase-reductase domain protein [Acidothermus cellulolyticus 11B]|jgi:riboflavin biosynthesis pyrimidine reductase|uniref:Bifunctional deaminase-reductase domain protein n=1 Tax=Acidothermus cellulolyticus (strain ATCC 43068 / DSM 8971 / 11B) TaxID=351607 RepID=A0LUN7_ACIC1|nr:pyrimidine reductase family protein [Acidothermus cellulolyticus]ABK53147.1 bifunctional deaminase-reductase domain protein [Acidothermus cellulolyticus 11B]
MSAPQFRQLYPASDDVPDVPACYAYPDERWLRGNMIASLDGAATVDGRAGPLGNTADQWMLALLRALADVVLVGAATAEIEGYRPIQIREEFASLRRDRPSPVTAIVSRTLRLDVTGRLFTSGARPLVITCTSAPARARHQLADVADIVVAGDETVDLHHAVRELADRGHRRLLCEGGPRLLAALAAEDLLDELCLTISPLLVAGSAPRILDGTAITPRRMRLAHLLMDADGLLYTRYVRRRDRERNRP